MKYRKLNLVKCFVVICVAIIPLIIEVHSSGSTQNNQMDEQLISEEFLSQAPPKVENISVKLLSEAVPEGNSLLLVRFVKGQKVAPKLVIDLEDQQITLRDDGDGGDEEAGDGIYSAITNTDLDADDANFQRVDSLLKQQKKPLTIPTFDSRVNVGDKDLVPLVRDSSAIVAPSPILIPVIGTPFSLDPEKSLVIRNTAVVEDPTRTFNPCTGVGTPMGKWTFGYLMQQMANQAATGINPSQFARNWLAEWESDQTINGWLVAKRLQIKNLIIDPWELASGGPGSPLDLSKAPFKLLAIVNRLDLRENTVYGGTNAGEARFVFGVIDRRNNSCLAPQFTVIFEYGIDRRGCKGLKSWAKQWYKLSGLVLGSPTYNAALEAITEQFVKAGVAPNKPNGSALNQLRTNEIALAAPWELREFRIVPTDRSGTSGPLQEVTVKQTPDVTLNQTRVLTAYVNLDTPAILANTHVVPDRFPTASDPFLAGSSLNPFISPPAGFFWNNPAGGPFITNRQARFEFSLDTCNACHAGETATGFTHIKPAPFGVQAALSGFMTGIAVTDPADGAPIRTFNELQRRALDLDILVHSPCRDQIRFLPILASH